MRSSSSGSFFRLPGPPTIRAGIALPSNTLDEADNAMSWDSLAVEAEGRRRGDASPILYTSGEPRFSSSSTTVRVGNGTLTSSRAEPLAR
jgi:hypothetical protein